MEKNQYKLILLISILLIALHGPMVNAGDVKRDLQRTFIAQNIVAGIRTFPLMQSLPFFQTDPVPYWQNPNSPYYQPYYSPYYYPYGGYHPGSGADTSPYPTEVKPAGKLFIQIEPLDAQVMVDGYTLKQKDDLTYEVGLFTGTHHVQAQKEGFKPYKVDVEIQAGMGTLITVVLEKLQK
jgi:hypothetical protein